MEIRKISIFTMVIPEIPHIYEKIMDFPRKNWDSSTQVTRNLWKTSEMAFPDRVDVVLKKSHRKILIFRKVRAKQKLHFLTLFPGLGRFSERVTDWEKSPCQ